MPMYPLMCPRCGWTGEAFAFMAQRETLSCTRCGHKRLDTDMTQMTPPALERQWDGAESVSVEMRFDPKGIAELKRDCPDIELNERGNLVFKSDRHQRKVYRQIGQALHRIESQEAEQASKEQSRVV